MEKNGQVQFSQKKQKSKEYRNSKIKRKMLILNFLKIYDLYISLENKLKDVYLKNLYWIKYDVFIIKL